MMKGDHVRVTFPRTQPFTATVLEVQAQGRTLVQGSHGPPCWVAARLCEPLDSEAPEMEMDLGPEAPEVRLMQLREVPRWRAKGETR